MLLVVAKDVGAVIVIKHLHINVSHLRRCDGITCSPALVDPASAGLSGASIDRP